MSIYERYHEISKQELNYSQRIGSFLFYCYRLFCDHYPTNSIMGDNLIMMWSNDYHAMRSKAEAYDKFIERK